MVVARYRPNIQNRLRYVPVSLVIALLLTACSSSDTDGAQADPTNGEAASTASGTASTAPDTTTAPSSITPGDDWVEHEYRGLEFRTPSDMPVYDGSTDDKCEGAADLVVVVGPDRCEYEGSRQIVEMIWLRPIDEELAQQAASCVPGSVEGIYGCIIRVTATRSVLLPDGSPTAIDFDDAHGVNVPVYETIRVSGEPESDPLRTLNAGSAVVGHLLNGEIDQAMMLLDPATNPESIRSKAEQVAEAIEGGDITGQYSPGTPGVDPYTVDVDVRTDEAAQMVEVTLRRTYDVDLYRTVDLLVDLSIS